MTLKLPRESFRWMRKRQRERRDRIRDLGEWGYLRNAFGFLRDRFAGGLRYVGFVRNNQSDPITQSLRDLFVQSPEKGGKAQHGVGDLDVILPS